MLVRSLKTGKTKILLTISIFDPMPKWTNVLLKKRQASSNVEDEESAEDDIKVRIVPSKQQLMFVHQTTFQRGLLKRYGNYACFLDATYKTTNYALPPFFLAVKTNVDYQIAGSFVIQDERKDSIKKP